MVSEEKFLCNEAMSSVSDGGVEPTEEGREMSGRIQIPAISAPAIKAVPPYFLQPESVGKLG